MFFISDAYAQAAGGGMTELAVQIVPLLLIFVVFWFFLIRPQQKRQKEHIKLCQSPVSYTHLTLPTNSRV